MMLAFYVGTYGACFAFYVGTYGACALSLSMFCAHYVLILYGK